MPSPKIVGAQRDFSAGEVDESLKRADELPSMKTGARQMSNWRILNSKGVTNRPGRSALFTLAGAIGGRVEEISMPKGNVFFLGFSAGALGVFNAAGTLVFNTTKKGDGTTPLPWTTNSVSQITYAIIGLSIYIFYADGAPNNVPQILTWDGGSQLSTWTLATFAETVTPGGQKRTAFYRISPQNITLQPSATSGNINITFSSNVLVSGMIGTRLEFAGRQLQIKTVASGTSGTATVIEPLPPGQTLTLSSPIGTFNIGDTVLGSVSGAEGIVTSTPTSQTLNCNGLSGAFFVGDSVTGAPSGATGVLTAVNNAIGFFTVQLGGATPFAPGDTLSDTSSGASANVVSTTGATLTVQLLGTGASAELVNVFTTSDKVVGPSASSAITTVATTAPQPVSVWSDEVMNNFRGWPSSCFMDQSRLGLTNFPSVPSGIAWSAIALYLDFYPAALGDDAIFELAPDNSSVLYVVPGMESSEFVFTDRAIYYIPILPTAPLEPGSVAFQKLANFGILAGVQPRRAEQSIVFMKPGGASVGVVQAPGAYYRPFVIDSLSEMHGHLFTASPAVAIAIPTGSLQYEELYIYILLANGSLVIGRYAMRQGLIEPGPEGKPAVGWTPWNGNGTSSYVAASQTDVIFTSTYNSISVVEKLDNAQFLDGALSVNNLPAPFTPPGGKGPLFNFPGPNSTVFLIDLGSRFMGVYNVDANGKIIPQNIDGENLSSAQLVAGQNWTAVLEPFTPEASPGQSVEQRMRKRRTSKIGVYVSDSTGFVFQRLFSGPLTPRSPPLGTVMNFFRITTYNQGDDPTQPAPAREQAYFWRPLGRDYDPRRAITKDTPGKILVHEINFEVTV